jgi:uncharacterized protein (DUF362 family)/NAD-dependent dihydropyrimidine dehydrogenase PreA subunit
VADSPANAVKLDRVWERTGFGAMCAAESVPLLNLEQRGSVRFEADGCSFTVARPVAEADVVINLPKVKTHMLTTLTAGVKNMYGIVPGFQKTHLHREHPRPSDFGRLMAAIYRTSPPALTIADAVTGMEGDGPSSGSPVRLGFLAASGDAVALDHVLCRMLGIPPSRVAYLTRLCDTDSGFSESAIRVAECSDDPVPPVSLRLPSAVPPSLIPRPLVRLLAPLVWIRPGVSDTCTSCGRCVRACPAAALSAGASGRPPALDPRRCIGCCCCHEVCPAGAIRMVQSPLLSLLRRGPLSGPA